MNFETLDQFISNWKTKVLDAYMNLYREYKELSAQAGSNIKAYRALRLEWMKKNQIGKGLLQDISTGHPEWFAEQVEKEGERKKAKIIFRVEKKAGKIIDGDLKLGLDGEINGTIRGEDKTVHVQTIIAGGYNIQCAHFRLLVK